MKTLGKMIVLNAALDYVHSKKKKEPEWCTRCKYPCSLHKRVCCPDCHPPYPHYQEAV